MSLANNLLTGFTQAEIIDKDVIELTDCIQRPYNSAFNKTCRYNASAFLFSVVEFI